MSISEEDRPVALRLELLGSFALTVGGQIVPPLSRSGRSLLALLALRSPRSLERDFLAATLWPDSDDAAAGYNLRRTLTELRSVLGPEAVRLEAPAPQMLRFDFSGDTFCDVKAFDAAVSVAAGGGGDAAVLEKALAAYADRGHLLAGERAEWVIPERAARAEAYAVARETLADLYRRRGETADSIRHLRAAVSSEPLRETAVRGLMLALQESGQSAAALAEYQELRDRLRKTADIAPNAETTRLYNLFRLASRHAATDAPMQPAPSSAEFALGASATGSGADASDAIELPVGAVTFLFTDIEGSTRNWQAHPDRMSAALARHDTLLRNAIEAARGVVFKTVGDGFCTAFALPSDALSAAVEAQRELQRESWPDAASLRVRMALHTGAAELRGGDYFGSTVNRTARLLSAGHGGQILVSAASHELLRDSLSSGFALFTLGKQWLRDLDRPEEIFAVSHPDLPEPGSFPPLRTLESPSLPNNLPRPTTSFIGREAQRTEVREFLAKTRLLTLVGTGGTGKTRLALQVAAEGLEHYPDGAWFVEFASISDSELVPQAVAQALGLKEQAGQTVTHTLLSHIQSKRMLLVLDNCEHLIESCARLAASVLRACPDVTLLATSREPLRLSGEQSYRIPPLSLPNLQVSALPNAQDLMQYEAIRLFIARASLVKSNFTLTAGNTPALAQLCYRLDGIPLALELAAARVSSLSVNEINERLGSRFHLLTNGERSALPRQRTLRALIDWSYDLLSEKEKILMSRLSVFADGCTLTAAEAICGFEPLEAWEVLDLLTSLVDKSLVLAQEEGEGTRFRMLETLRQYAAEKREGSGETKVALNRHSDWYLGFSVEAKPRLLGPSATEWHARLKSERENLRAALACFSRNASDGPHDILRLKASTSELHLSVALLRFWLVGGFLDEGREHLSRALIGWRDRAFEKYRVASDLSPERDAQEWSASLRVWNLAVAGALTASSMLANAQGDSSSASPMLVESLALCRALGDKEGIASSLAASGTAAFNLGDFAEARLRNAEALSLYRELGDPWPIASCLNNTGTAASEQGDYEAARALFAESLALRREIGEPNAIADSLNNVGIVSFRQGDLAAARAQHEEGMAIKRTIGDKDGVAKSLINQSLIAMHTGDYTTAAALLNEGLVLSRELGDKRGAAITLDNLGSVSFYQGDIQAAYAMFEEALSVRRQIGDKKGVAASLSNLAETAAMLGDSVRAGALQMESLAMHRETGDKRGSAIALLNIGSANFKEGRYQSARALYHESLSLFREMGNKSGVAQGMGRLAELALEEGEARRAVVLWSAADALRVQSGLSQHSTEKAEAEAFAVEAQAQLGNEPFAEAVAAGLALDWEIAVAEALSETHAEADERP